MASQGTRADRARRMLASWLTILVVALFPVHQADATRYVYDPNGRLVVVTDDSGESARYVYDVMGNIVRIERVQASELRIFAMTPLHGTVDTPVSIRGQGFSSVAANDAVNFNGVPAVVSSATANELKVNVPFGATTGPVTVTVDARSANSDTPFTVDETGLPPVIGAVSPDVAVVGNTLGVDGTYLYPIPGKTSLRIGGRSLDIGQGSNNAHLAALLPASASSGRISVQTPYGTAESMQTVLVVPPGITPASVRSRGVTTLDASSAHVDLADNTAYGAVMFDSDGKSWISLQLANFSGSATSIGYTVYAPGNTVVQSGTVSANAATIHLSRMQSQGTYLVLFKTANGSSSFDVSAVSNPSFTDAPLTLATQGRSQSVRAVFSADAKETLVVKIANASTEPVNASVTYSIYTPSGAFYTSGVTSSAGSINLPNLPSGGTWQLVASPGVGVRGSMQVSVIKGTTGVLQPGANPVHLDAQSTGQNVYMDFHANPFDNVELTLAAVTLAGTTQTSYQAHVYGSAGNEITYVTCYTTSPGGNCNVHLWYLAEGDYRVVLVPNYGGTLHLDAVLQKHLTGRVVERDTTTGIDLALGQSERLTFDAQAGDTVALYVGNVRTTPTGKNLRFYVYRPDAGAITTSTASYTNVSVVTSNVVNLPSLPVSGRYTVIVSPEFGLPASAQLSVLTGTTTYLQDGASATTLDTHVPGQSMYLDFDAGAGESIEFTLAEATLTGASYPSYAVDIRDEAGRSVASRSCYVTDPGCQFHLWYLAGGHYRATVTMTYGGTFHGKAMVRKVKKGRSLSVDIPLDIALDKGEVEHFTFHANAGDTLAFAVNSALTTPAGQEVRYIIYRPDAGQIATATPSYTELKTTGARLIDLPRLPVTGDYVLAIASDRGVAITTQVQFVSGRVGSLPADGGTLHFETQSLNQSIYVDFMAHAGESLEFTFANVVQAGASYGAYAVNIQDTAGRNIASTTCYVGNPGCELHLWNLAAGNYRAIVTTPYGGTLQFDVSAKPLKILPQLTSKAPLAVSLERGEAGRLTFHADAGDTLALFASSIVSNPSGRSIRFIVYRPDSGTISTSTPGYTEFTSNVNKLLDLPYLPVSGDYTIIAIPEFGVAADMQLELLNGSDATLSGDGSSHTFETDGVAQTTYIDFVAQRGDNLELAFSNVVQTGASYNAYVINIRDEAGRNVSSGTCYVSDPGCEFHLWAMAPGNYRATVSLNYGGTLRFDAVLRSHRPTRILAFDTPASFDLGTGDVQRLTFHANAGDTVAMQATGVVTSPSGRSLRYLVYRPDTGTITTSTPSYLDFTSSGNQLANLPKLPVTGDYTVLVIPSYGVAAHARLDLVPGTVGTLETDAIAQTFNVPAANQLAYIDFHARPFDDLEFALSNVTQTGTTPSSYRLEIFDAGNRSVSSATCYYGDPGCEAHLWYMTEGDYRAVITLNNNGPGHFDASVKSHKKGTVLTDENPQQVILGSGQAEQVTFDAVEGDTRSLQVQNLVTVPAGKNVRLLVYSPSSGAITGSTGRVLDVTPTGNQLFNLQNLPATGRYTVMLLPSNGVPASFDLTERFVRSGSVPVPKPTTITVDAAPAHFISPAAGQEVSLVFATHAGENLELALTHVTQTNNQTGYYVNVYDPSGARVVTNTYCYTSNPACPQDIWNTKEGTYTVTITPQSGATVSFDAVVRSHTMGGVLARGASRSIMTVEGEMVRYTFDAQQGETLALFLSGIVTTPTGLNAGMRVYRPDGGLIGPSAPYSSTSTRDRATLNLTKLPVSGTYTVVVNSDYLVPFSASLLLAPGALGGTLATDVTSHIDASAPGQIAWFDVDTGSGGNFDIALSNVKLQDTNSNYQVSIYNAAGVSIDSFTCYVADPGCTRDMWNVGPGTYRVAVLPQYNTSKLSFDAVFMRNKEKGTLAPGAPSDIGHATGDVLRYTFQANQGDTVGLNLAGTTTAPTGRNTSIRVYRPDGALANPNNSYASYSTKDGGTLNLADLPAGGTYTVVVNSDYLIQGEGKLTLVAGASGIKLADGLPVHTAVNAPGQNAYFDIDVEAMGNYELSLSGVSSGDGRNSYYTVNVYTFAGLNIDSYTCYPSDPGCTRDFWNLAAGRYRVIVQPAYAYSALSMDAVWRSNVEKGALQHNVMTDISHVRGDVLRYTFQGSAGETVALRLGGLVTTPSGYNTGIRVYRPDGGVIKPNNAYGSASSRPEQTLNLPSLPSTGTYTVVVNSDYLLPGTGTLTLVDGIFGTALTDDVIKHFEANAPGQNLYFDADFGTGGDVDLTLFHASSNNGSDSYYTLLVYSPEGALVDNVNCYPSSIGCARDYWNAAPGTYHIVVQPAYPTARMTLDAVVRHNKIKGNLIPDMPVDIAHEVGDVLRYTFQANVGDTVALRLSDMVNSPTNINTNMRVYRPDGGRILPSGNYSLVSARDTVVMNLTDLPIGGTYTVVVNTDYLAAGQGKLSLVTGASGIDLTDNAVIHARARVPGQSIYMDVDAGEGGNFDLTLAATAQDPSTHYITVTLLNAAGGQVDSYTCYTSDNCPRDYWNLAAGKYRIAVTPGYATDQIGFDARFLAHAYRGTLVKDVTVDVTHGLGEFLRFTFDAHRKDSVALHMTGAISAPSGHDTYISVFRPDGGLITPNNRYALVSTRNDIRLNLPNLPIDGKYTVIINNDKATAGQGTLTLISGTTP